MFDKLRRRRRLRAAALPAPHPAPAPPVVADAALLARVDRVRSALAAAGVNLDELGAVPAPTWFAHLQDGYRLLLGPTELKETADHLPGVAVEAVLSDEACTRLLRHIEALTALRDLKEEGLDLRFCHGDLPDASTVRSLADYVRDQVAAAAAGDDDAATNPGHAA